MRFRINKDEFFQGIQEAQRVIYLKGGFTTLQGVLIKAKKDYLLIAGGDKNLYLETEVKAEVYEEGSIVVESKLLGDIIRKLPNAPIEVSTVSDRNIKIICDKNIINLVYQDEDSFPKMPEIKEDIKVSIPQKVMKRMIKGTTFATDQSGLRPIYSGVLFHLKDTRLNMVALDGIRAAICYYLNGSSGTVSAVIPGRTLNEVAKISEIENHDIKITFTSNQILFTIGKTKVISTLLDGEFGKYETFIPNEYTLKVTVNKQSLIDNLERASIIGREGSFSAVLLDILEDKMHITSNSQIGDIKGEIDVLAQGLPMRIKVNSKFLLEALNAIEDEEIMLKFTSSLSVFVITGKSNDNSTYLISPVRM
ncbi:DNA polymerase-3 subunit beta [Clostridium punense]|uniref:Beta sliding clamp n=1 Tax=Clostridium punense TaxID=1054297 RepID=A0ABS4K6D8_9CLOT|nr:DNA polymerase III subunit beta [Clostridium punense]MBP2023348.1 DNA polymerase-3 subunit beta [Clostridium punense]